MGRTIRVGSRDSALALVQARIVIDAVKKVCYGIDFEVVPIRTAGDRMLDRSLDDVGGKGLFIKELEQALIDGCIDIAVHSYKDMPFEETEGLPVVALSEREAPFDVLVLPRGTSIHDKSAHTLADKSIPIYTDGSIPIYTDKSIPIFTDESASISTDGSTPISTDGSIPIYTDKSIPTIPNNSKPIGSSSLRRTIQFKRLYDGYEIKPIRGNVPTRLSKLDNGEYSALILAQAGLNRLSLQDRISRIFTVDEMIPAASQGILAVQGRAGEDYSFLDGFHNKESEIASNAERMFIKALGGGCSHPTAAYGLIRNHEILLTGMYVDANGGIEIGKISGSIDKGEQLGETLAVRLRERAGEV